MDDIIKKFDKPKSMYMLKGLKEDFLPEDIVNKINSFLISEHLYVSAAREIQTKLENLNSEFKYTKDRNPIHLIKTRIKTPKSIMDKLSRRGLEVTVESARQNLTDIAGIRVICPYIDDIYLISTMLALQDDIVLIRTNDYIRNPKPNGYRSLHLIVSVPVFLSDRKELVKAEVQIRTIAMDFWASLEHDIAYKLPESRSESIRKELKDCANLINNTDKRMQNLYNILTSYKTTD